MTVKEILDKVCAAGIVAQHGFSEAGAVIRVCTPKGSAIAVVPLDEDSHSAFVDYLIRLGRGESAVMQV